MSAVYLTLDLLALCGLRSLNRRKTDHPLTGKSPHDWGPSHRLVLGLPK